MFPPRWGQESTLGHKDLLGLFNPHTDGPLLHQCLLTQFIFDIKDTSSSTQGELPESIS
jgi:hypothetical protein